MIGAGYWMTLLYAFFVHSRIVELIVPGLRLPLVLAACGMLLALASGTIVRGFTSRVGIFFLLMTAWFCVGVPFSAYPTGALMFLINSWSKNWILFILVVALVTSRKNCSRLMVALAIGSTVAAVGALLTGNFAEAKGEAARLALEGSSLDDPNTFGMTLLIGLPLWMTVIADRARFLPLRLAALLCTLPIFVAIPMTGSRGTLVGAMIVVAYMFKRFSIGGKVGLIVVVSLVAVLTVTFLAEDMLQRYTTVTDPDQLEQATQSESRVFLFKQGLRLIAGNPLTGVGIGMFAVAENELAMEQGAPHGTWHTCHNMFMQVASEGGIPAFVLYLMILWTVWKTLTALEKVTPEEHPRAAQVVRLAFWLRVAFLAFCACGVFLSTGLSPIFIILTSLPLAFARIVRLEIAQLEEEKSGPAIEKPAAAPRLQPVAAPVQGLREA
jgi:O-antigen ligase